MLLLGYLYIDTDMLDTENFKIEILETEFISTLKTNKRSTKQCFDLILMLKKIQC